jgi:broad specificity phosphatase PhoE
VQVSSAAATLVGASKLLDPYRLIHVFVSPRLRAKKTFKLLLAPSSSVAAEKVTYTKDIAEWNYSDYEGLINQEIRDLRKERGLDLERKWDIWLDRCKGREYIVP